MYDKYFGYRDIFHRDAPYINLAAEVREITFATLRGAKGCEQAPPQQPWRVRLFSCRTRLVLNMPR